MAGGVAGRRQHCPYAVAGGDLVALFERAVDHVRLDRLAQPARLAGIGRAGFTGPASRALAATVRPNRDCSAWLPPAWSQCECVLTTRDNDPAGTPWLSSQASSSGASEPKPVSTRTGFGPVRRMPVGAGIEALEKSDHAWKGLSTFARIKGDGPSLRLERKRRLLPCLGPADGRGGAGAGGGAAAARSIVRVPDFGAGGRCSICGCFGSAAGSTWWSPPIGRCWPSSVGRARPGSRTPTGSRRRTPRSTWPISTPAAGAFRSSRCCWSRTARGRGEQFPLPLAGAAPVMEATRLSLAGPAAPGRAAFPPWAATVRAGPLPPYAPVPGLIEAACLLYATHGVSALLLAARRAGRRAATKAAVARAMAQARTAGDKLVVFVTGAPGAGKTLCGLDLAFAPAAGGRVPHWQSHAGPRALGALVRDAVGRGLDRRAAQRRMEAVIQPLPGFRDHYVGRAEPPGERLLVIDEAQRCWSSSHAVSKTRNRPVALGDFEPGHLLDIMARLPGWAVLVCLVGGGQEIHDGEGGLASWGDALQARPGWRAWAPEAALCSIDPRQRLPALPGLRLSPDLHLELPVRSVHAPVTASWVEAVLADAARARGGDRQAAGGVPFADHPSLDRDAGGAAAAGNADGRSRRQFDGARACGRKDWAPCCRTRTTTRSRAGFSTAGPTSAAAMRSKWLVRVRRAGARARPRRAVLGRGSGAGRSGMGGAAVPRERLDPRRRRRAIQPDQRLSRPARPGRGMAR